MGYWGEGLFQNDTDLDILSDLAHEASVDSLYIPDDPNAVRDKLNDGTLKRLLTKLNDPKIKPDPYSGPYHNYCILAAAAMTVGAKIDDKDMTQLRRVYKSARLLKEGTQQMEKALNHYKNDGTPWDFESLGLLDTMELNSSRPDTEEEKARGFKMHNVFPEGTAEAEMMELVRGFWAAEQSKKGGQPTASKNGATKDTNAPAGDRRRGDENSENHPPVSNEKAKEWLDSL